MPRKENARRGWNKWPDLAVKLRKNVLMDGSATYDVVTIQYHEGDNAKASMTEFYPSSRADAEELIMALIKGGAERVEDEERQS